MTPKLKALLASPGLRNLPKTVVDAILALDARIPGVVEDVTDERRVHNAGSSETANDGIWVYLSRGYCWGGNPSQHSVHEWSATDLVRELKHVVPCSCPECGGPLAHPLRKEIANRKEELRRLWKLTLPQTRLLQTIQGAKLGRDNSTFADGKTAFWHDPIKLKGEIRVSRHLHGKSIVKTIECLKRAGFIDYRVEDGGMQYFWITLKEIKAHE